MHSRVAYNFEREIEEALEHIYATYNDNNDVDDDLYNVSLRFRLLRQQGFKISCGKTQLWFSSNMSYISLGVCLLVPGTYIYLNKIIANLFIK